MLFGWQLVDAAAPLLPGSNDTSVVAACRRETVAQRPGTVVGPASPPPSVVTVASGLVVVGLRAGPACSSSSTSHAMRSRVGTARAVATKASRVVRM